MTRDRCLSKEDDEKLIGSKVIIKYKAFDFIIRKNK